MILKCSLRAMEVVKWHSLVILFVIKPSGCDDMEGRIVGGEFANILNYPHSVYLSADCDESWVCGSSILNQKLLLTAAHCVDGCRKNFNMEAWAGSALLDQARFMRNVKRYVMHGSYEEQSVYCDIALVMLGINLPLGLYTQRVWIHPYFSLKERASVAGWGVINDNDDDTIKLKKLSQSVLSIGVCRRQLSLLPGQMCASSNRHGEHPAKGDSGSALITSLFQQIGVVSFRVRQFGDMIVYTNVSHFYPWILAKSVVLNCYRKG